jgi:hypothetical protein
MSETLELPIAEERAVPVVRRVFAPDIQEVEPWLMPKLLVSFPSASALAIRSALHAGTSANDHWISRTENAVLAARLDHEAFASAPTCKVWFALCRGGDEHAEEIAELFACLTRWMGMGGVRDMILSPHIDCDRSYIKARIGRIGRRDQHYWSAE